MMTQMALQLAKPEDPTAKLAHIEAEQGTVTTSNIEHLEELVKDLNLWETEEEFDDFLAGIARTRSEKG